jgi:D-hexose-6-phosphate mutarotase
MTDLPKSVRLDTGEGGLPVLRVAGPEATADIYLHGAHVTAWAPRGAQPVLWTSPRSRYTADAAIRGGVPICFPWFGAHPADPAAPSHGFARLLDWELADAADEGDDVVVTLLLRDSATTRSSPWPHAFTARYTVRVGRRLTLGLTVVNEAEEGADPFTFEAALHTYLAVADVRQCSVHGLEGVPFLDRNGGPDPQPGQEQAVTFPGEVDRVYLRTPATTTVHEPADGRRVEVTAEGSDATVVWSPGAEKAAAMVDVGADAWTGFVCVETCNVRASAVRLGPGERHTMTATYAVHAP